MLIVCNKKYKQIGILSTKQLPDNALKFSPRRTPPKDVLLPLSNHKYLKTDPNYHLQCTKQIDK